MSSSKEIKDFGAKIGGARKELYRNRGLRLEDLKDLDSRHAIELVTRDTVWPAKNWDSYVGTMDTVCIYFMKRTRDKFSAKVEVPAYSDDVMPAIENYINVLNAVRDCCSKMESKEDIPNTIEKIRESVNNLYRVHTNRRALGISLPKIYQSLRDIGVQSVEELEIECDVQGFPAEYRPKLKDFKIRSTGYKEDRAYYIWGGNKLLTNTRFYSEEEAIEYAKTTLKEKLDGIKRTRKESKVVNVVRPQLEYIERVGPNIREGRNVETDQLLNEFKFRGGEFGNWNNQQDRQAYLNYAYDAFMDLMYVLKLPVNCISLGKRLSGGREFRLAIAFGSRGVRNAAAHYEPGATVINLTKLNGAGSFAHEWGHAFDNFLANRVNSRNLYLSDWATENKSRSDAGDLERAMIKVIAAMYLRAEIGDEVFIEKIEDRLGRLIDQIDRWRRLLERVKEYLLKDAELKKLYDNASKEDKEKLEGISVRLNKAIEYVKKSMEGLQMENVAGIVSSLDRGFENIKEEYKSTFVTIFGQSSYANYYGENVYGIVDVAIRQVEDGVKDWEQYKASGELDTRRYNIKSKFLESAEKLDENRVKPYYSVPREMFARCFESYVEDRIHEMGMVSQYLVHSASNEFYGNLSPYPGGKEREDINSAIAELVKVFLEKFGHEFGKGNNYLYDGQENVSYRKSIKERDSRKSDDETVAGLRRKLVDLVGTPVSSYNKIDVLNKLAIFNKNELNVVAVGFRDFKSARVSGLGNSKAFFVHERKIFIDSEVKNEKQIEGLIEITTRLYINRKYKPGNAANMVSSGVTYMLCKKMGLDVRTYMLGLEYEVFVKDVEKGNTFIKLCKENYLELFSIIK